MSERLSAVASAATNDSIRGWHAGTRYMLGSAFVGFGSLLTAFAVLWGLGVGDPNDRSAAVSLGLLFAVPTLSIGIAHALLNRNRLWVEVDRQRHLVRIRQWFALTEVELCSGCQLEMEPPQPWLGPTLRCGGREWRLTPLREAPLPLTGVTGDTYDWVVRGIARSISELRANES